MWILLDLLLLDLLGLLDLLLGINLEVEVPEALDGLRYYFVSSHFQLLLEVLFNYLRSLVIIIPIFHYFY